MRKAVEPREIPGENMDYETVLMTAKEFEILKVGKLSWKIFDGSFDIDAVYHTLQICNLCKCPPVPECESGQPNMTWP